MGHKRAIFWLFLEKGVTGYTLQCQIFYGATDPLRAKTEPKAFWGHTRRKLKTKTGVAPLLSNPKDSNSMKFDETEKANLLLSQFSSVFTREPEGEIPRIAQRTTTKIPDLIITVEMVLDALKKINVSKSCGPENLHLKLFLMFCSL